MDKTTICKSIKGLNPTIFISTTLVRTRIENHLYMSKDYTYMVPHLNYPVPMWAQTEII